MILKDLENKATIAKIIKEALEKRGIFEFVDANNLNVTQNVIMESTGNKNKISESIFDFMFPHSKDFVLYHYTTLDALRNIANTNELRLYELSRNIDKGEFKKFAEDYNFSGFLNEEQGNAYYRHLAKDLFYFSFTKASHNNQTHFWDTFGNQGKGVRLKFSIKPKNAELRVINYQDTDRKLLKDINDSLYQRSFPPFVPHSISMIGAFYLPRYPLVFDDEIRLLVKRHQFGIDETKVDGDWKYWPFVIGKDNYLGRIDLIEIKCGNDCEINDVKNLINSSELSNSKIVC